MKMPFTTEQFLNAFEQYNRAVFPGQIIVLIIGFGALIFLHSEMADRSKLIGGFLGGLWIWTGLIYHIIFFSEINKGAFAFGCFFALEGIFLLLSTFRNKLVFSFKSGWKDTIGYFFILFGLVIYPILSFFMQGSFITTISLGLPCPSTIFTFGFFILAGKKFPKYLLIIPSVWAIIGLSAAINFGVYPDFMILISAIFAFYIAWTKTKMQPTNL